MTLAKTLPPDTMIAEEAPSTHTILHDYLPMKPGHYFAAASGSLGYGLPAAVGVALATPGKRVRRDHRRRLELLRHSGLVDGRRTQLADHVHHRQQRRLRRDESVQPALQLETFAELRHRPRRLRRMAKGFGMAATRVERTEQLVPALEAAYRANAPVLIDVIVETAVKKLF